ncbi:MAG: hypothetical protein WC812_01505 [Candidatus Pacearchaeota archaeon]|jgi:hypothetical protein
MESLKDKLTWKDILPISARDFNDFILSLKEGPYSIEGFHITRNFENNKDFLKVIKEEVPKNTIKIIEYHETKLEEYYNLYGIAIVKEKSV